jgi:hypothetical protein
MMRAIASPARAWRRRANRLAGDREGVGFVEFAVATPVVLLLGLAGMELANLAVTHLRLSQAAMHIADNASRIGTRDALAAQRIFESDINDLFVGVNIQAGSQMDLYENGRVILSSLEQNAGGGQWIHWQRCMGKKNFVSNYGPEGTGATGTAFAGMGETGNEVTAPPGSAVMYVEIAYTYTPIVNTPVSDRFVTNRELKTSAAFIVRNPRDLTGIFQTPTAAPVASCDKFQKTP